MYNDLTAKRLALVMNKHVVAQFEHLNVKKFVYNPYLDKNAQDLFLSICAK